MGGAKKRRVVSWEVEDLSPSLLSISASQHRTGTLGQDFGTDDAFNFHAISLPFCLFGNFLLFL